MSNRTLVFTGLTGTPDRVDIFRSGKCVGCINVYAGQPLLSVDAYHEFTANDIRQVADIMDKLLQDDYQIGSVDSYCNTIIKEQLK